MFTVVQSRRWFAPELSCWITQEKVPASWEDAQRSCERHGAVLASPLNTQLHNYLQSRITIRNDTVAYFLGTRAKRSDDGQVVNLVSLEGRQLDDMPMAVFDAITQLDLEQGDCLCMDRRGIRAVSCWDHLPYICYSNETAECGLALETTTSTTSTASPTTTIPPALETTTSTTSTASPTTTIPPGYTFYPATGSSYKYHHDSFMSWHVANSTCASEGARLLVLNDADEADLVNRIVREATGDAHSPWTGLRDTRPGGVMEWSTVDGAVLASPLNTQLHNYLQSRITIRNDTVAYFLGTRAKRSDDGQVVNLVSLEGRQLDDMPMAVFDAITQLDLEQGDCLCMDRRGIRAVSCWDHLPYICYSNETAECGLALETTTSTTSTASPTTTIPPALETTTSTTSTASPTTTIPPGYTFYPATGSSYKYHHDSFMSWHVANSTCASEGARLLVLNDADEADLVNRIVREATGDAHSPWTGLRDTRPGGVMEWSTVDGTPLSAVFHEWSEGRPFNDARWACAVYSTYNKRLYDVSCDYTLYFVCEISQ